MLLLAYVQRDSWNASFFKPSNNIDLYKGGLFYRGSAVHKFD